MKDDIIKTALRSVLVIVALTVFAISFMSLATPSAMVWLTENVGMDKAGVTFRATVYNRMDEGDESFKYLTELVERSIYCDAYEKTEKYGQSLIADARFDTLCAQKDSTAGANISAEYKQFVYGGVAVARYECGNVTDGITLAIELNEDSFAPNNAVMALALRIMDKSDASAARSLKNAMTLINNQTLTGDDASRYDAIYNGLDALT